MISNYALNQAQFIMASYQELWLKHCQTLEVQKYLSNQILEKDDQINLLKLQLSTHANTIPSPDDNKEESAQSSVRKTEKKSTVRSRKQSRSDAVSEAAQIQEHSCSYENCKKSYTTAVSLNLHIKLKHNGGTKKQREAYAKIILDAQKKGFPRPQIGISLPPGFLQNFKANYRYNSTFQM